MTMNYLVTNIMDQGEGNYREWYDFVWNRTRGIRKVSAGGVRCVVLESQRSGTTVRSEAGNGNSSSVLKCSDS